MYPETSLEPIWACYDSLAASPGACLGWHCCHRDLLRLEPSRAVWEQLAEFLPEPPRRLLEIGCGAGILASLFLAGVAESKYAGVDSSPCRWQETLHTLERCSSGHRKSCWLGADVQRGVRAAVAFLEEPDLVCLRLDELDTDWSSLQAYLPATATLLARSPEMLPGDLQIRRLCGDWVYMGRRGKTCNNTAI